ncbi:hypothetical protein IW245_002020 [Longispora fulva]|uniref:Uncharacterized protein n=1 Tax=Longispora fulva TaxID=619741 RepID=A0A8J7GRU9_9ACTN|nr:hypothetical protein [Longispora fulva]
MSDTFEDSTHPSVLPFMPRRRVDHREQTAGPVQPAPGQHPAVGLPQRHRRLRARLGRQVKPEPPGQFTEVEPAGQRPDPLAGHLQLPQIRGPLIVTSHPAALVRAGRAVNRVSPDLPGSVREEAGERRSERTLPDRRHRPPTRCTGSPHRRARAWSQGVAMCACRHPRREVRASPTGSSTVPGAPTTSGRRPLNGLKNQIRRRLAQGRKPRTRRRGVATIPRCRTPLTWYGPLTARGGVVAALPCRGSSRVTGGASLLATSVPRKRPHPTRPSLPERPPSRAPSQPASNTRPATT